MDYRYGSATNPEGRSAAYNSEASGRSNGRREDRRDQRSSAPAKIRKKEAFLMGEFFVCDDHRKIHRDVMKIRVRQHLGNSATCRYAYNENGRPGHAYRAERPLTEHELDDLERDTVEYMQNAEAFQQKLDRYTYDHSQWTDVGNPGHSSLKGLSKSFAGPGYDYSGNIGDYPASGMIHTQQHTNAAVGLAQAGKLKREPGYSMGHGDMTGGGYASVQYAVSQGTSPRGYAPEYQQMGYDGSNTGSNAIYAAAQSSGKGKERADKFMSDMATESYGLYASLDNSAGGSVRCADCNQKAKKCICPNGMS